MRNAMKYSWRAMALAVALITAASPAFAQSKSKIRVETLASDKFEGRLTGSPGEKLASDFIISELQKMGAKPLPGQADFRSPFTFTAGSKDGGSTVAVTTQGAAAKSFAAPKDVIALSFSDTLEASGP